MAGLPTIFEKRWPSVILTPISVSGHIITVSSTLGLKVKQKVTLRLGIDSDDFEIKRVLSDTTLHVGPIGKDIALYSNPTAYSGGTLEMQEQKRNEMGFDAAIRSSFEEEPVVAIRTLLVDPFGAKYSTTNPLPVQLPPGSVSVNVSEEVLKYRIINLPIPLADTDHIITLPANIYRFTAQIRDGKGPFRIYETGGAIPFFTITRGSSYDSITFKNTSLNLVIQSAQGSCVLELMYWVTIP